MLGAALARGRADRLHEERDKTWRITRKASATGTSYHTLKVSAGTSGTQHKARNPTDVVIALLWPDVSGAWEFEISYVAVDGHASPRNRETGIVVRSTVEFYSQPCTRRSCFEPHFPPWL